MAVASHHLGSFLNQCFETTGMPVIHVPTLSSVPSFAFVTVSGKIHLTENSTDLIF